jgi:hypothetical protein
MELMPHMHPVKLGWPTYNPGLYACWGLKVINVVMPRLDSQPLDHNLTDWNYYTWKYFEIYFEFLCSPNGY